MSMQRKQNSFPGCLETTERFRARECDKIKTAFRMGGLESAIKEDRWKTLVFWSEMTRDLLWSLFIKFARIS